MRAILFKARVLRLSNDIFFFGLCCVLLGLDLPSRVYCALDLGWAVSVLLVKGRLLLAAEAGEVFGLPQDGRGSDGNTLKSFDEGGRAKKICDGVFWVGAVTGTGVFLIRLYRCLTGQAITRTLSEDQQRPRSSIRSTRQRPLSLCRGSKA